MNKILFFFILPLFLFSCSSSKKQQEETHSDPTNISLNYNESTDRIPEYKTIRFIPLETNEKCLIGDISKIVTSQEYFYIFDRKSSIAVYVFTKYGEFVKAVGSRGRGPREYAYITDIAFDPYNQQLIIVDPELKKIIKFDSKGDFIEEVFLGYRPYNIGFIDEDTYAIKTLTPDRKSVLITTTLNGDQLNVVHQIVSEFNMTSCYYFPLNNGQQQYFEHYKDTIWKIELNKMVPQYSIDYDGRNLTTEQFNELRNVANTARRIPKFPSLYAGDIRRFIETEDYIQFFYMNKGEASLALVDQKTLTPKNLITYNSYKNDPLCTVYFRLYCSDIENSFVGHISAISYLEIKNSRNVIEKVKNGTIKIVSQGYRSQDQVSINSNPIITVLEL